MRQKVEHSVLVFQETLLHYYYYVIEWSHSDIVSFPGFRGQCTE